MHFLKKLTLSLIALLVVFSQLAPSFSNINVAASGDITLRIGVKEEIFTKSERMTFDVWARDENNQKIDNDYVQVTNELEDGSIEDVPINWSDEVKTSYTATLIEGLNTISVYLDYNGQQLEKTILVTYEAAAYGDVIGEFTFSMDAFVVGLGYLIEPIKVPIINGENAAMHLERTMYEYNFITDYTGSPERGYYLSLVSEGALLEKEYDYQIPQAIHDALERMGEYIDESRYDPWYGLGEFDFNSMSGWMYAVNNVFPNVGFSDYYLMDEDIMRVQFTVAYGSDIGGGYASGGSEYNQYFDHVNKDFLTEIAATINSSPFKDALYANTNLETYYRHVIDNVLPIVDISQEELDEAEANLRARYDAALPVAITKTIDMLPDDTMESERELMELIRYQLDKLSSSQLAETTNLAWFEVLENKHLMSQQAFETIQLIMALPTDITLNNGPAIEHAYKFYSTLTEEDKAFVTNSPVLIEAYRVYSDMAKVQAIDDQLLALPAATDFELAHEELLKAAVQAYEALSNDQKALVQNTNVIAVLNERLVVLKDQAAAATVDELIQALPLENEFKLSDSSNLAAAQFAYEQLTDVQKQLVEHANILQVLANKLSQLKAPALAIEERIKDLPMPEAVQLSDGAAILDVYESYNNLSLEEQELVQNSATLLAIYSQYNDLKSAQDVEQMIVALPHEDALTIDDEQQLSEALNAYEELTEAQKQYVTNKNVFDVLQQKLLQIKEEIATAELNMQKAQEVIDAINQLPEQLTTSSEQLVQTIKTTYDLLTNAQKELVANYDKLEQAIETIQHMKAAEHVQKLIENLPDVESFKLTDETSLQEAQAAYDELLAVQQEFVKNASKLNDLQLKLADLKAQAEKLAKDQAAATSVDKLINTLPVENEFKLTDESSLQEAQTAYEALTEEQKAFVKHTSTLEKLTTKLAALKEQLVKDQAAALTLSELIAALPKENDFQLADETPLQEAQQAYAALTATQQTFVENATKLQQLASKLTALKEQLMKDKAAAANVTEQIAALPTENDFKLTDEKNLQAAQQAYKALTAAQQALVENTVKLEQLAKKLAELKDQLTNNQVAALKVKEQLAALPAENNFKLTDEKKLQEAQTAYDALTADQKALVENAAVLKTLSDELQQLKNDQAKAVAAVEAAIKALPTTAKLSDEIAYTNVKKAYDALSAEQKKLVTNAADLTKFSEQLEKLKKDNETALIAEVVKLIAGLPEATNVKLTDETVITTVGTMFNKLTAAQQKEVTNSAKLKAVKTKLEQLKKEQQNEKAVTDLKNIITALPAATQITLANKEAVQYARNLYNALTTEQKAKITAIDKLVSAEFKVKELEAEVTVLVNEINLLPATITEQHKATIESLRKAYGAFTSSQKLIVSNIAKLTEAEKKLAELTAEILEDEAKEPENEADKQTDKDDTKQPTKDEAKQQLEEELKEAIQQSEGIVAVKQDEQTNTFTIEANSSSTQPAMLSHALLSEIEKTKAKTIVVRGKHNIRFEMPMTMVATGLSKNAAFEIDATPMKSAIQPSVKIDFKEVLSNGIKREMAFTKQYATVKLPLSLFHKSTASTKATQANEQGVILRKTANGLAAVPHKIINGEAIIFANTNAEYVYSTDVVTFDDIANVGNKDDIEFLATRHVVKGYSEDSYGPGQAITRAQFATMMTRALNLLAQEEPVHTDTTSANAEAIQALYEAGITNAKGEFKPGNTLTREQAASFMYRLLQYAKPETTVKKQRILYKDVDAIGASHMSAVIALYELGIMEGKPDGSFDPKGNLTRAQMAKILRLTLEQAGMM